MFILHRCVINNAGQCNLTIVANCREVFLTAWDNHSKPTHKYIFLFIL